MIEQAVILAGGRGERLRPLTDTLPKCLAPVNGRPFIFRLLDQLAELEIKRVVILTGYLGHLVEKRCRHRHRGMAIAYDWSAPENDTGQRIRHSMRLFDERFLLCYGDTYAPQFSLRLASDMNEMANAQVTIATTTGRPGNVSVESSGEARYYLTSSPTISTLDAGYMIVRREAVWGIPDRLPSLLNTLGNEGKLSAYAVGPVHTIDDAERLAKTAEALA